MFVLVVAIADGSIVRVPVVAQVPPSSAHHHPLEIFRLWAGIFVTRSAPGLLLGLAALLMLLALVERVMGTAWTVLAFVVTSLVGVTAGVALQSLGVLTHPFWTTPEDGAPAAGLSTPIVGALLTASAFAGPLWRRRIRLLVLSGSVIVLLYSGQPGDLYRLLAALSRPRARPGPRPPAAGARVAAQLAPRGAQPSGRARRRRARSARSWRCSYRADTGCSGRSDCSSGTRCRGRVRCGRRAGCCIPRRPAPATSRWPG